MLYQSLPLQTRIAISTSPASMIGRASCALVLLQKAAQEAKKLAEEAKEAAEATKAGATDSVSRAIDWVFEKLPFLEPLRHPLQPLVDFLVANALYVRLGLGLGFMIFVWFLTRLFANTTPVRGSPVHSVFVEKQLQELKCCAV